ncbi:SDR family NAD(P)-dependent oxidoreductase [Paraconexibacter sp.]|uniref:SDR family NAD(P)-dependent oxidoreductase n=1 Tax=Paraconexibacter sp. TaxID=2949640 RepID=UPI00356782F9
MALPDARPGTVVLVTGASSGIGEELARQLAALGHDLVLIARRADRLDALASELRDAAKVDVDVHPCDLGDAPSRASLIAGIVTGPHARPIAGLCNNAGFGLAGPAARLDPARQRQMIRVNVEALHDLTLAVLPGMLDRGEGAILNVASVAAFQPLPNFATYSATKAFVQTFSEALHAEVQDEGVSVTSLCPGPVPTEFGEVAGLRGEGAPAGSSVPSLAYVSAHDVAAQGIEGMVRGRRSVIPGAVHTALALSGRFTPRSLLLPLVKRFG